MIRSVVHHFILHNSTSSCRIIILKRKVRQYAVLIVLVDCIANGIFNYSTSPPCSLAILHNNNQTCFIGAKTIVVATFKNGVVSLSQNGIC